MGRRNRPPREASPHHTDGEVKAWLTIGRRRCQPRDVCWRFLA